jgi:hypothetical protein
MANPLYNPFLNFNLSSSECFITGKQINTSDEQLSVFPEWIMDRYELRDKTFTMLGDGNIRKYQDLTVPCAADVMGQSIQPLEKEIESAFSKGYDEVIKLPKERIFQWITKLVYGILYNDLKIAIQKENRRGERFELSPYLETRFTNLHLMLQSIATPMKYKGFEPWSIEIVKINYSKDIFNYKDETNKLNFSLGMNDFGIVCCLQDNGVNSLYHKKIMDNIQSAVLHPIQFEELCGRFIYSNYLLKGFPTYKLTNLDGIIQIEPLPFREQDLHKMYDPWEDEMFAQVLANYWKPWGITMNEIITFPNSPISYLVDEYTSELITPSSIKLPF